MQKYPSAINGLSKFQQHRVAIRYFGCLFSVLLCLAVGCTDSAPSEGSTNTESHGHGHDHDHDHGHRPESYTAAVAEIKRVRDEVKAAFDANTPKACDDALHVVVEVLEVLPETAAETDLPKEDWQVVKDQAKILFDQFMKVHDGFHGEEAQGASFDSVAEEIDKAIEVLESKIAATGEKVEIHSDHDHGDHDHSDHDHSDHDHEEHDHEEHDHEEHGE